MKAEISLSRTIEVTASASVDIESIAFREWCASADKLLRVVYFNEAGERVSRTFVVKEI